MQCLGSACMHLLCVYYDLNEHQSQVKAAYFVYL
jgi:hypothetical protein